MWLYSWFVTEFLANRKFANTTFYKEFRTMAHVYHSFSHIEKILPRYEIDRLDRKYGQGDRRRKTSRYVQFIVMLMAHDTWVEELS